MILLLKYLAETQPKCLDYISFCRLFAFQVMKTNEINIDDIVGSYAQDRVIIVFVTAIYVVYDV